ncbi:MAG: acetyl-CoA acetyltransferase [Elusimicrobia bacterium RIFOXYB2_FULL_48_7]|nr:MAG: acetyl-CoA acetyltransferase [Elusimicrobia bacterium RIFOXYB2_FULL_48_7]
MRKVVIAGAKRTAIGSFGGSLMDTPCAAFTADLIKGLLSETGLDKNPEIDEVILGNVSQAGQGQNPARQASIKAGLNNEIPSYCVNMVCGSGMKAIILGSQMIGSGEAECIIAGGMENMSQAPYLLKKARWGLKAGNTELLDSMITDGLWDAFNNYHMGVTAENVAEIYSISRKEQDLYAFNSQKKCAAAQQGDFFKEEIFPIKIDLGKKGIQSFEKDEYPKPDTALEKLALLKPAFKSNGTVTAANSSGINDGAAIVVLMSEEKAKKLNINILGEIASYASAGLDPAFMGMGPVPASNKALASAGLSIKDIDLAEINEAFACQSIAVLKELKIDEEKVNIYGGAIALGHPIGASGARIVVTLLNGMKKKKAKHGLASLCIGGGQGVALIVRRDK